MKEREKVSTFLGKGTQFEGRLTFHRAIRIDGHFRGEISSDGILIVGEWGIIEANNMSPISSLAERFTAI